MSGTRLVVVDVAAHEAADKTNRAAVRSSTLDNWLPHYTTEEGMHYSAIDDDISGTSWAWAGAVVLRAADGAITEIGRIDHGWSDQAGSHNGNRVIVRSIVIDDELWTLSYNTHFDEWPYYYVWDEIPPNGFYGQTARLQANDFTTLDHLAGFDI